jgi:hypothetical protein
MNFGYHFCMRNVVTLDLDLAYPTRRSAHPPDIGGTGDNRYQVNRNNPQMFSTNTLDDAACILRFNGTGTSRLGGSRAVVWKRSVKPATSRVFGYEQRQG